MELLTLPHKSPSETGNVELLDVRPVPKRPIDPPPDITAIGTLVAEGQKQTLQAVAQVAQQVAQAAVREALNASGTSVIGALHAIGILLAVRFILLLSLCGAFALAVMAMQSQTYQAIGILVSFVALTVIPLVWLDRNGRRKQSAS